MRALICSGLLLLACSGSGTDNRAIATGAGNGGQPVALAGMPSTGGSSSASSNGNGSGNAGEQVVGGGSGDAAGSGAGGAAQAGEAGSGTQAGGESSVAGTGGASSVAGGSAGGQVSAGAGGLSPGGDGGAAGDGGAPPNDCVCDSGPCCDGCHFRPKSHFCGEVIRASTCLGDPVQSCSAGTARIQNDYWNLFCSGDSSECTRWAVHTKYVDPLCGAGSACFGADGAAACMSCP